MSKCYQEMTRLDYHEIARELDEINVKAFFEKHQDQFMLSDTMLNDNITDSDMNLLKSI